MAQSLKNTPIFIKIFHLKKLAGFISSKDKPKSILIDQTTKIAAQHMEEYSTQLTKSTLKSQTQTSLNADQA